GRLDRPRHRVEHRQGAHGLALHQRRVVVDQGRLQRRQPLRREKGGNTLPPHLPPALHDPSPCPAWGELRTTPLRAALPAGASTPAGPAAAAPIPAPPRPAPAVAGPVRAAAVQAPGTVPAAAPQGLASPRTAGP